MAKMPTGLQSVMGERLTSAFSSAGVSENYHSRAGVCRCIQVFASDQDVFFADKAGAGGIFDLVGGVLILELDLHSICD